MSMQTTMKMTRISSSIPSRQLILASSHRAGVRPGIVPRKTLRARALQVMRSVFCDPSRCQALRRRSPAGPTGPLTALLSFSSRLLSISLFAHICARHAGQFFTPSSSNDVTTLTATHGKLKCTAFFEATSPKTKNEQWALFAFDGQIGYYNTPSNQSATICAVLRCALHQDLGRKLGATVSTAPQIPLCSTGGEYSFHTIFERLSLEATAAPAQSARISGAPRGQRNGTRTYPIRWMPLLAVGDGQLLKPSALDVHSQVLSSETTCIAPIVLRCHACCASLLHTLGHTWCGAMRAACLVAHGPCCPAVRPHARNLSDSSVGPLSRATLSPWSVPVVLQANGSMMVTTQRLTHPHTLYSAILYGLSG